MMVIEPAMLGLQHEWRRGVLVVKKASSCPAVFVHMKTRVAHLRLCRTGYRRSPCFLVLSHQPQSISSHWSFPQECLEYGNGITP
ncbi:hypothetical protein Deval_2303 [Nitratidesulfovibrio vulgaris RCH1]|nr:hypothetical protein Deval_2303 [Nitratidesulfovibrio vulgaris RCH1]